MVNRVKNNGLALTIVLDMFLTIAALLSARWIRGYFPAGVYLDEHFSLAYLDKPIYFFTPILIPLVVAIWLTVFSALSIYNTRYLFDQYQRVQPIFTAITLAVLVFAGIAYLFFPELSRFLFFYFYILDIFFLVGWRKLMLYFLRDKMPESWQPAHRILIAGQGALANDVARAIQPFAWMGMQLVGFAGTAGNALGHLDDLPALVKRHHIDEVIFALSPENRNLLQDLVYQLQPLPVNLRLVPDIVNLVFVRATIEDFAGLPLIGLREPAIEAFDRLVKRAFDLVISALLTIFLSPLFLAIAILIKLDSGGKVFYSAKRTGEGGKIFDMLKFRTMVVGADEGEQMLFAQHGNTIGLNKNADDPRVTRIGRILRRFSLDELPQFWNVLKGDMSLVGPRPELPWLVDKYEPWQHVRFTVPQGMTGWWQVKNRAQQKSYDVRVEDDLYYIHNYSFFLDLRILFMTMSAVIRGDGAY